MMLGAKDEIEHELDWAYLRLSAAKTPAERDSAWEDMRRIMVRRLDQKQKLMEQAGFGHAGKLANAR